MKRKTPEEKYTDCLRKQQRKLEEFAEYEYEWSGDLIKWYGVKKLICLKMSTGLALFFVTGNMGKSLAL